MNGQFQPKYVGTFRKVDAGMVIAAGKPFLLLFFHSVVFNEMKEDYMHTNFLCSFNIFHH